MKKLLALFFVLVSLSVTAQVSGPIAGIPNQFLKDFKYGPHKSQALDIYLPVGSRAPIVILIHGGGFTGGDRWAIMKKYRAEVKQWCEAGFGVATVDYRLLQKGAQNVLECLQDCELALKVLKQNPIFRVDSTRIGLMGVSAGGGASLWISTNTQIKAVAAINAQSSYDLLGWGQVLGVDITKLPSFQKNIPPFYGAPNLEAVKTNPTYVALRHQLEIPRLMQGRDTKYWLQNDKPNLKPDKMGIILHHPLHCKAITEAAQQAGAQVTASAPAIGLRVGVQNSLGDFFLREL